MYEVKGQDGTGATVVREGVRIIYLVDETKLKGIWTRGWQDGPRGVLMGKSEQGIS